VAAATKQVASTSDSNHLTRMIELLIAAAVLLGIGGAYGLWVTSDKR
jgi:hypothetical protein